MISIIIAMILGIRKILGILLLLVFIIFAPVAWWIKVGFVALCLLLAGCLQPPSTPRATTTAPQSMDVAPDKSDSRSLMAMPAGFKVLAYRAYTRGPGPEKSIRLYNGKTNVIPWMVRHGTWLEAKYTLDGGVTRQLMEVELAELFTSVHIVNAGISLDMTVTSTRADCDEDGDVDQADYGLLQSRLGSTDASVVQHYDQNGDGRLTAADLARLASEMTGAE